MHSNRLAPVLRKWFHEFDSEFSDWWCSPYFHRPFRLEWLHFSWMCRTKIDRSHRMDPRLDRFCLECEPQHLHSRTLCIHCHVRIAVHSLRLSQLEICQTRLSQNWMIASNVSIATLKWLCTGHCKSSGQENGKSDKSTEKTNRIK